MLAESVRGEWEAELGRGRGIVVRSNGGFPPPVSQTHHVTHPEKERDTQKRQFIQRLEGSPQVSQSVKHLTFVNSVLFCYR